MQAETVIYTIGHSNHPIDRFLELLMRHDIKAVADVRSSPSSRHVPQFNKETLAKALERAGIKYVFLGDKLGARPKDPACYENGRVDFRRLAARQEFRCGIERVLEESQRHRLALMCAEKEPLDCHRTILICRHLSERGVVIKHILANGELEDHRHTVARLRKSTGLERTLFDSGMTDSQATEQAYDRRAKEIAFHTEKEAPENEPK